MVSDLVAVPVVLATLGAVGICAGWTRRRIHAQMADARTSDVRELATAETVEIEGEAHPLDDPTTASVTGRDAVVAVWTVEEWDERGDTST